MDCTLLLYILNLPVRTVGNNYRRTRFLLLHLGVEFINHILPNPVCKCYDDLNST
jgi:hypothetical protein